MISSIKKKNYIDLHHFYCKKKLDRVCEIGAIRGKK